MLTVWKNGINNCCFCVYKITHVIKETLVVPYYFSFMHPAKISIWDFSKLSSISETKHNLGIIILLHNFFVQISKKKFGS